MGSSTPTKRSFGDKRVTKPELGNEGPWSAFYSLVIPG